MPISRDEVIHVARLARLDLSDEEIDRIGGQLDRILEHAERVTSLETDGVPPTSHPVALSNILRPDDPTPSLQAEDALAGAPETERGHFKVPRILEDEA